MSKAERLAEILALELGPVDGAEGPIRHALAVARFLQTRGQALQTPAERRQQQELHRMLASPRDKATVIKMTDQAFRARRNRRAAEQLAHILDVQGIPGFFSPIDRAMLGGFRSFGAYLPGVSMPLVKAKMRDETANVVLPAEAKLLISHLKERKQSGIRMNVNLLGEALLGEHEAKARLETYLETLQLPDVEVISVKVSTLYSQITPLARQHSLGVLCERYERLLRGAGSKFVYLDMEEYRDLELTLQVFMNTLARPGLEHARAGIALQAYIPDSLPALDRIHQWARNRVSNGGAAVTVRLVKGANMEMERFEAVLYGWPQAPFDRKSLTDANFKVMLHRAMEPKNAEAVRLGIASHNLFDVAYGLVLASEKGVLGSVQFEMLEGMANHQRRALAELVDDLLLYAPATKREDFVNAIGYLIRRFDENTGPDNFLRHAFSLEVGTEEWNRLEREFLTSFEAMAEIDGQPRRHQDRSSEVLRDEPNITTDTFYNEPDTDFSLDANLAWAERIAEEARALTVEIPVVVAGSQVEEGREQIPCRDPSRPGHALGYYRHASFDDVERALVTARADPQGWRSMPQQERAKVLGRAAEHLRVNRAALLTVAMAEGGKLLSESDPEVSEAIDFVRYYTATANQWMAMTSVSTAPRGVVVVVTPWNFPIAIPCGGVASALAAGNTVILKPAPETVATIYTMAQAFWQAGVSQETLQFLPCFADRGAAALVADDRVDAVILTGGTETAQHMLSAKPEMTLFAETGGKNATIITAMADRDLAIKSVVHSAFSHGGQKCSATSLLILEAEVFDDSKFRATLTDAVESLHVGSAYDLHTKVPPLIREPEHALAWGLSELSNGETWALESRIVDGNPNLRSPAIRWGTPPGSKAHQTEFFGPVLSVLRAKDLKHALELANGTGYGLTAGLQSLDEREHELFRAEMKAGNLYINRGTTGAIVRRQPFGGMKGSAFGPGIKAGGPNYVAQLMHFEDQIVEGHELFKGFGARLTDLDRRRLFIAQTSYQNTYREHFSREHDPTQMPGQRNIFRYLPATVRIRLHADDSGFDILARILATRTCECSFTVSVPPDVHVDWIEPLRRGALGQTIDVVVEEDAELARIVGTGAVERVRYAGRRGPRVVLEAAQGGVAIVQEPVLAEGRVELLWYLSEQSISHDTHRYGNLSQDALI